MSFCVRKAVKRLRRTGTPIMLPCKTSLKVSKLLALTEILLSYVWSSICLHPSHAESELFVPLCFQILEADELHKQEAPLTSAMAASPLEGCHS